MNYASPWTHELGLQNAVVFGRKTWESVIRGDGVKWQNRFNIVLTRKSPLVYYYNIKMILSLFSKCVNFIHSFIVFPLSTNTILTYSKVEI